MAVLYDLVFYHCIASKRWEKHKELVSFQNFENVKSVFKRKGRKEQRLAWDDMRADFWYRWLILCCTWGPHRLLHPTEVRWIRLYLRCLAESLHYITNTDAMLYGVLYRYHIWHYNFLEKSKWSDPKILKNIFLCAFTAPGKKNAKGWTLRGVEKGLNEIL